MRKRITALIASLFIGAAAHAGVHVDISGSGTCTTPNTSPGSSPFTITASSGCNVLVKVYGDSTTDDIGRITLTGAGTVALLVGQSGSFPTSQTAYFTTWVAQDWGGLELSSFSGAVRVAAAINQDITGSVTATQVFRVEANRDIKAAITATAVDPATTDYAVGAVWAGRSITSDGSVVANATPGVDKAVTLLEVQTGTVDPTGSVLAGSITATHGRILSIICADNIAGTVTAPAVGDSTSPGDFDAINAVSVTDQLSVTGNVYGNISVAGFSSSGSLKVEGDLKASIIASTGDITSVTIIGNVLGYNANPVEIVSTSGAIGSISVSGDITTDGVGGLIIDAADGIDSISCASMSYVTVGPQTFGTGHVGIPVGSISVDGDAYGTSFHLTTFDSIDIGGTLGSEVLFIDPDYYLVAQGKIVVAAIPAGKRVRLGILGNYSEIATEGTSPGLVGQVILNPNDAYGSPYSFLHGQVAIRTSSVAISSITSPYYSQASSTLGGGAVGVVPYPFYRTDCSPTIPSDNASDNPLVIARSAFTTSVGLDLAFKGPVFTSGGYVPFAIYRSLPSDIADATCRFTQTISGRVVSIRATDSNGPPAGIYHITSERNLYAILCNDVLANPMLFCDGLFPGADLTTVESVDIWISIPEVDSYTCDGHGDCVADYDDGSGTNHPDSAVTIDDLLFYLTIFTDGALCADIDDGSGDGSGDGVPDSGVTIDDLLYYLTRFVDGC